MVIDNQAPVILELRVEIIRARGLAAADKTGFSDPYVVIRVNNKKYKTKVVKQTLDPTWETKFDISLAPGKLPQLLNITVWDKDTLGRDFLGELNIPFKNVFDRNAGGTADGVPRCFDDPENQPAWFTLNKRKENNNVSGDVQIKFGFVGDKYRRSVEEYSQYWNELTHAGPTSA